jgi:hypothetical protein
MTATRTNRKPQQPEIRELRVDYEAVYQALDSQRRHRNRRFCEVAAVLGVNPATICGWGHGVGFSADHLARALAWLGRPLSDFTTTEPAEPRPVTQHTAA